jgi:hypothetical protein
MYRYNIFLGQLFSFCTYIINKTAEHSLNTCNDRKQISNTAQDKTEQTVQTLN